MPLSDQRSAGSSRPDDRGDDGTLERTVPGVATTIRAAGFWAAIVLPLLYVPLLATGLSSSTDGAAFLLLIAGNLFALYVGHSYRR